MKIFTPAALIVVVSIVSACSSNKAAPVITGTACEDPRPQICTMDYNPACGQRVDGSYKTYGNACGACGDEAVVSYQAGACAE